MPMTAEHRTGDGIPWPQIYGQYLEQCRSVFDVIRAKPQLRPDLVVAHGGRGAPTLFLRDVLDCPIINYCEYYFATSHRDISYRIDLPPAEPAPFFPRCINAPTLADAGRLRRRLFGDASGRSRPSRRGSTPRSRSISTGSRPSSTIPARRRGGSARHRSRPGTRVVTFVSRGLESIRGFDLFMKVADRIARARPDVLFVVVGGEEIHYGWDKLHTGAPSFKQWVLSPGQLRPVAVRLPGAGAARATGRHPPHQRPAHLPDGAVRALVVAPECDGQRLRGAGLGRPAGARGDPPGRERPGRAALRRRTPDRDGARRCSTTRPSSPRSARPPAAPSRNPTASRSASRRSRTSSSGSRRRRR